MNLYLTKGMFGEVLKEIGTETESPKNILEHIFGWKNDLENQKNFKIEKYDRLIFGDGKIAIDFGDYSTFMLIDNVSEDQKDGFINV